MNQLFEELTDDEDSIEVMDLVLHPRKPQTFRNRPNHFEIWCDTEFKARFRLEKRTVRFLIDQMYREIAFKVEKYEIRLHSLNSSYSFISRNCALTPDPKIFVTLRYLSTGSILQVLGDFNGIDKSTASRVVHQVTRVIARLSPTYIQFPEAPDELEYVKQGFFNISKFPRCIGAIDCTHIKIQSPGGPQAENYRNRKGFFSFNIQVVCDSELMIRDIVCRWPGAAHDAHIFRKSNIRAKLENGVFTDNLLVGDSGYGVKTYLITPLGNPRNQAEQLFNESQIRTRNPVERCFGVWKRRFPVLAFGIRLKIQKVESIVIASAVLHNIACMMRDVEPPANAEIEAAVNFANVNNIPAREYGGLNNSVRHALIYNYFANL